MPASSTAGSVAAADVSKTAGRTKTAADRANSEAGKLLEVFNKAKPPAPDNYMPNYGMPGGGDINLQPGLYTGALIGPGVWPTESESELAQTKTKLKNLSDRHQKAADEAKRRTDEVFSQHWTDGDGSEAAYEHYSAEHKAHLGVVDVLDGVADTNGRLGEHIRLAKRNIRDAHDAAHREIEDYLKAPGGVPTAQIAVITTKYRTLIEGFRGQLVEQVGDETTALTNHFGFPEAPPGSPGGQDKPSDRDTGDSSGDPRDEKPATPVDSKTGGGDGPGRATGESDGAGAAAQPDQGMPTPIGPLRATGGSSGSASTPKPSMPSMPSTPSMGGGGGSGGGGSSPLSSLGGGSGSGSGSGMGSMQGMGSGANGLSGAGNMSGSASGLQGSAANATPASLGNEFSRGVAAGSAAAGGAPPLGGAQSAPPQPPSGPLSAAPLGQTSAAAASAPVTASTPPSSAAPAMGGGGGMGGVPAGGLGGAGGGAGGPSPQMTPYGSVLPQSPGGAAGGAPGGGFSGSAGAPTAGAAGAGAAAGSAGFLPGLREVNTPQRVGRDVSMTDLEAARSVVADLAAASSVVYPGLEWAVAVSRGASGLPEMWVTTNEGAGYIPAGVHIPRSMPLAAHFDPDFDSRWFGWFNPAETVLRAVRARGDAVSAIATTWAQDSEEVRSATPDVAIGVAPLGGPGESEATALTRGRSHRLETIAPAIFNDLQRSGPESAESYARQLTQQVVFSGPEMSPVAMSVARGIIANQWPSESEWSDLASDYEMDRLMAGSQRPGLMGVEEPHQLAAYQRDFANCRRLETLLCWQSGDPADVVYAAITAGVAAPAMA